jgi:hypothetical protein
VSQLAIPDMGHFQRIFSHKRELVIETPGVYAEGFTNSQVYEERRANRSGGFQPPMA